LLPQVLVVAQGNYSVAVPQKLRAQLAILGSLGGIVVHCAVAEDADVGIVEEVGHAAGLGEGFLGLIGKAIAPFGQQLQEAALQFRAGIDELAQPLQLLLGGSGPGAQLGAAMASSPRRSRISYRSSSSASRWLA
jgi:hypothetical protein